MTNQNQHPAERISSETRPTENQKPQDEFSDIDQIILDNQKNNQQLTEEIWPKWQQIIIKNLVWYREGEKDHGDLVIAEEEIIREVKSLLSQARQQAIEECLQCVEDDIDRDDYEGITLYGGTSFMMGYNQAKAEVRGKINKLK